MLEVGNGGMTYQEYRAHFSIWALMKVSFDLFYFLTGLKFWCILDFFFFYYLIYMHDFIVNSN